MPWDHAKGSQDAKALDMQAGSDASLNNCLDERAIARALNACRGWSAGGDTYQGGRALLGGLQAHTQHLVLSDH